MKQLFSNNYYVPYAYFLSFIQNISCANLELDLEHYVVPSPSTSPSSALVYAANITENPRSLGGGSASISSSMGDDGVPMINQQKTVKT